MEGYRPHVGGALERQQRVDIVVQVASSRGDFSRKAYLDARVAQPFTCCVFLSFFVASLSFFVKAPRIEKSRPRRVACMNMRMCTSETGKVIVR